MASKKQGPLAWNVPIVDSQGLPTKEFMRKWVEQVSVNTGIPTDAATLSTILDFFGTTRGAIIERGASQWGLIVPGPDGTVLRSSGPGTDPAWAVIPDTEIAGTSNGAVPYVASGFLAEDGANFFWDAVNKRLGIGTNTPAGFLDGFITFGTAGQGRAIFTGLSQTFTWAQASINGPALSFVKARGTTISGATPVLQNDLMGNLLFRGGINSTSAVTGASVVATVIEPTPSVTKMGGRLAFNATKLGAATVTEVVRIEADTGLSMFGANPVIDQNRLHILRGYATGSLPTGVATGALAYDTTTASPKYYDGAAWNAFGGGSGGTPAHPGYVSGNYYGAPGYSANTTFVGANTLHLTPMFIPVDTIFSKISIRVSTGVAATNARIGIYGCTSSGAPTTLVADCGTVATTTSNTQQEITGLSLSLAAGWYWFAVVSNGNPSLFACGANQVESFILGFPSGPNIGVGGRTGALTYGALPSTPPSTSFASTVATAFLRL